MTASELGCPECGERLMMTGDGRAQHVCKGEALARVMDDAPFVVVLKRVRIMLGAFRNGSALPIELPELSSVMERLTRHIRQIERGQRTRKHGR